MNDLQTKQWKPLDPKEWALTIFLSGLPIVGLILLLIWAFDDNTNIHKKNWAKGSLILLLVVFALFFIFMLFFGGIAIISNLFN